VAKTRNKSTKKVLLVIPKSEWMAAVKQALINAGAQLRSGAATANEMERMISKALANEKVELEEEEDSEKAASGYNLVLGG
jgi:hypothetical protein